MAQRDVEVVLRALEAFNRGDVDGLVAERRVAQVYRLRGRGRASGVPVDMRVLQTTVRDRRMVHRRIEPS